MSMPDLQKLKVILLERHQEPVLLFLSKMGVVQYIKVNCEEEPYDGFLKACPVPKNESLMNLDLQTRITRKLEEFNLKPDNEINDVALLPGNTIEEILFNIEKKLAEIEDESNNFIELLDLASNVIKETGQQLQAWELSHKKLNSENKANAIILASNLAALIGMSFTTGNFLFAVDNVLPFVVLLFSLNIFFIGKLK